MSQVTSLPPGMIPIPRATVPELYFLRTKSTGDFRVTFGHPLAYETQWDAMSAVMSLEKSQQIDVEVVRVFTEPPEST